MLVNLLTSLPLAANALPAAVAVGDPSFKKTLDKLIPPPPPSPEQVKARKQAEDAASDLVSNALILPILKQVRRSPFNTKGPFSPGIDEKAFGPEFDMQLADRIARSPRLEIKNSLADRLMKRSAAKITNAPKGMDVHG